MAAAVKLLRHAGRSRAGRFLAEGPNLVEAAVARGLAIEVFAAEDAAARYAPMLGAVPVHLVTERAAKVLSDTVTPAGLVAVCETPVVDLPDEPALVAVAAGVSEPGNAGTLIRIADAMGAAAVVFTGNSVDPYNGKCLRASAGSIFNLPVVLEPDAVTAVRTLRDAGLRVLATTLAERADHWGSERVRVSTWSPTCSIPRDRVT